jgi:hypothetical protein
MRGFDQALGEKTVRKGTLCEGAVQILGARKSALIARVIIFCALTTQIHLLPLPRRPTQQSIEGMTLPASPAAAVISTFAIGALPAQHTHDRTRIVTSGPGQAVRHRDAKWGLIKRHY